MEFVSIFLNRKKIIIKNYIFILGTSNERKESFEYLKSKIDYLQGLVDSKQSDINNLKEAFDSSFTYYNELIEKQKIFLDKIRNHSVEYFSALNQSNQEAIHDIKSWLLSSNLTNYASLSSLVYKSLTNLDVEFKDVFDLLPHLNGLTHHAIQPKFKQSKNRFGSIVIGIPTIKREKASYLLETLKSVFDAMSDEEKNEAVVVIFIPEVNKKKIFF